MVPTLCFQQLLPLVAEAVEHMLQTGLVKTAVLAEEEEMDPVVLEIHQPQPLHQIQMPLKAIMAALVFRYQIINDLVVGVELVKRVKIMILMVLLMVVTVVMAPFQQSQGLL
jgi:hypothetical protein